MPSETLKAFTAELTRPEGTGTWTYVTLPCDVKRVFGTGGRVAVRGTIDGEPVRGSLMPHGDGRHFLVVNKAIRTAIGKEAGESVRVTLERDREPRTLEIPDELARALAKDQAAKEIFGRLSHSHRKEYVTWIEEAKKTETRERRALKAVEMLGARKSLKGTRASK